MKVEKKAFITLQDYLKKNNLVQTGGEAKILIQTGKVFVNEYIELRRGKKLKPGDQIKFKNKVLVVEDVY